MMRSGSWNLPWFFIVERDGQGAPFYSVMNHMGMVVATHIYGRATAELICAAPEMYTALLAVLEPAGDTPGDVRARVLHAIRRQRADEA